MKLSVFNCTQQYLNLLLCYWSTKHCPFVIKTFFVIPRDAWLNFAISTSAKFLLHWILILTPSKIFTHVMSKFMFKWTENEPCFTKWLQDSTREVAIASMQFLTNRRKWLPNFASLLRRFSCSSTTAWQHNSDRSLHVRRFVKNAFRLWYDWSYSSLVPTSLHCLDNQVKMHFPVI